MSHENDAGLDIIPSIEIPDVHPILALSVFPTPVMDQATAGDVAEPDARTYAVDAVAVVRWTGAQHERQVTALMDQLKLHGDALAALTEPGVPKSEWQTPRQVRDLMAERVRQFKIEKDDEAVLIYGDAHEPIRVTGPFEDQLLGLMMAHFLRFFFALRALTSVWSMDEMAAHCTIEARRWQLQVLRRWVNELEAVRNNVTTEIEIQRANPKASTEESED